MWNISVIEETASTNTLALELLERDKAKHGDVIQARHQTGGRGRAAGRIWNDEHGASLLMSIVFTEIPEPVHLLQYRSALAVIQALRKLSKSDVFRLKWPNDILLNGKKICGLLLEAQWNGAQMRWAVIGIGVNVKQKEFPGELRDIATSLALNGIVVEVDELRDAILEQFEFAIQSRSLFEELRKEFEWLGTVPRLTWIAPNEFEQTDLHYSTLLESGALELKNSRNESLVISSGTIRW